MDAEVEKLELIKDEWKLLHGLAFDFTLVLMGSMS